MGCCLVVGNLKWIDKKLNEMKSPLVQNGGGCNVGRRCAFVLFNGKEFDSESNSIYKFKSN